VRYFTEIGLFVFDRWQQISADYEAGSDIDEIASDGRWDECTQQDLDRFKERAQTMLAEEAKRVGLLEWSKAWGSSFAPLSAVLKAFGWIVMEALRGFVGAIGILIFGLIFLWLAPSVTKAFRAAIDDLAPIETRPGTETGQGLPRIEPANAKPTDGTENPPNS